MKGIWDAKFEKRKQFYGVPYRGWDRGSDKERDWDVEPARQCRLHVIAEIARRGKMTGRAVGMVGADLEGGVDRAGADCREGRRGQGRG